MFEGWHRSALEAEGHLVFPAGPDQETRMIEHLAGAGYMVASKDRMDVMVQHLRSRGVLVFLSVDQALDTARRWFHLNGWAGPFPPHDVPEAGQLWSPSRGKSSARLTLPCDVVGHVRYRNLVTGTEHVIALRTWSGWISKARATTEPQA